MEIYTVLFHSSRDTGNAIVIGAFYHLRDAQKFARRTAEEKPAESYWVSIDKVKLT